MPEDEQTGEVTKELRAFTRGDLEALDRVMELVYAQLRRVAHKALRAASTTGSDITLETGDVFHESFLKLRKLAPNNLSFDHRGGFFRYCIRIMQSHLREHAEKKRTLKRGGGFPHVSLDDFISPNSLKKLEEVIPDNNTLSFADVLAFEDLLKRHAREFERQADVMAYRVYLDLTETEIAQVLGTSTATVNRDLRDARKWLASQWNSNQ
jgi:RNA polymerase sigma factor (TIGR02999 family)